jgi:AraC-like DNA-binding protein
MDQLYLCSKIRGRLPQLRTSDGVNLRVSCQVMSENRQSSRSHSKTPLVEFALPSPLFGLAEDRGTDEPIPPHHHDSAQLIHASHGVMTVETDDGLWVVPPARAVWVPAFVTHSIAMSGTVRLKTLYLDPASVPIQGRHCCVVQVSALLHGAILRAVTFRQPYPADGPEARIAAVILDEIRAAKTAPLHLPTPNDPRARRVANAFRAAPSLRKSRRDWAHEAGASERTLERLFHAEVGTSFGKWQQQARLLRALEILAAGESVTSTALEVGFETPSAFIAMFRRAMGTTPARYFQQSD